MSYKKLLLCFSLLSIGWSLLLGQVDEEGPSITCFAMDSTLVAYTSPPTAFLSGSITPTAEFDLDFAANVPSIAQAPISYAASIWASYLVSDIPIRVEINWLNQGDNRLLASAGPTSVIRDFAQAPQGQTWYPVALAESITGQELNASDPDIVVTVNSTANWYFGEDGNVPPGQIDLVSVALHELGHGLGFLATTDTLGATQAEYGIQGLPIVYDQFVEDEDGVRITNQIVYPNPGIALRQLITIGEVFFGGDATIANFGTAPPLFSPGIFDIGSSVSHLCEFEFPTGSENALMTPQLAFREAVHDPGPLTLAMLADMGWSINENLTSVTEFAVHQLKVYPNPGSDFLWVNIPVKPQTGQLQLQALNGSRLFTSIPVTSSPMRIDLQDLPKGWYLLSYQNQRSVISTRILIQ